MIWKSAKSDSEDMEAAANLAAMVESLDDSRVLRRFLLLCAIANFVVWMIAILMADWVYTVMERIVTDKLGIFIVGVPLALGLFISYCLFRLKLPDIEDNTGLDSEMMSSFAYQAHSTKRWLVWIFSVLGGIVNVLLLILANMYFADQL